MNNVKEKLVQYTKNNAPQLLMGAGIASFVSAIILSAKAGKKAEKAKKKFDEKTTKKEKAKVLLPIYAPTAITAMVGAACVLYSGKLETERSAAFATMYEVSRKAYSEYREAVKEEVGKKKEEEIQAKVAKNRVETKDFENSEFYDTGYGTTKFYDPITDTPFLSDIEYVRKTVNDLNRDLRQENYLDGNEWRYRMGLRPMQLLDMVGWHIDSGYLDVQITPVDEYGIKIYVLDYEFTGCYGQPNTLEFTMR